MDKNIEDLPIEALPNLGPLSQKMLATAGIHSVSELRKLGAVASYVRVKRLHANASLNLLWALEGALSRRPWQEVARTQRLTLLLELESYESEQGQKPSPARSS